MLFTEEIEELIRRDLPLEVPEDFPVFYACTCRFHETLQIADIEPDDEMNVTAFSSDAWVELGPEPNVPSIGLNTSNRILGNADPIQFAEMDLECQLVSHRIYLGDPNAYHSEKAKELASGVKDWILLFQLDSESEAGMTWGDVGRLYFWIRKDDLKNRNFDDTWMILQCY